MNANVIRKAILAGILAATAANSQTVSPDVSTEDERQARIAREARHEIVTLPYFDQFDNIELRLDGSTLTLSGQVTKPSFKAAAESELREIEGAGSVVNNIEVCRFRQMTIGCGWRPIAQSMDTIRCSVIQCHR
jgi:osmotically-inducible protein OsmY